MLLRPEHGAPDAKRLIDEARGLFPENPHFKDLELNHELVYGDPQSVVTEREEILRQQGEDRDNWSLWRRRTGWWHAKRKSRYPTKRAEALAKARDLLQRAGDEVEGRPRPHRQPGVGPVGVGDFAGGEKC